MPASSHLFALVLFEVQSFGCKQAVKSFHIGEGEPERRNITATSSCKRKSTKLYKW